MPEAGPRVTSAPVEIEVRRAVGSSADDLREDAAAGLAASFKKLPPKYFYDELGSELFERITALPEYYPTRAEWEILRRRADEVVAVADPQCLIELGSGSATKTRALLDAMRRAGSLHTFVPVDISEAITRQTAMELIEEYPGLRVHGVICDFERDLERLPGWGQRRMLAFLGGTIGNFAPPQRTPFLARIAGLLGPADTLLLGTDLVKEPARIEAAYNDSTGITERFNKNVLTVLNRELGGEFDLDAFDHRAVYDPDHECVDIRLRSRISQSVPVATLGTEIDFDPGEDIRTELSCKFSRSSLEAALRAAGLELIELWVDSAGDYALSLSRAS